ncbi:MAG TPA: thioredoxin, partial [Hydrogenophaga sp.]
MTTAASAPVSPRLALPTPTSLRAAAQKAVAQGEPLVVMTTLAGCPYCDLVRQHHLLPMLNAGEVVAVQIDIRDRRSMLQGFQGESSSPAEQVAAWKAKFAPTVLFFGARG